MARAATLDDIEPLYESCAKQAVGLFNKLGSIAPQIFMLSLGDDVGQVTGFGALHPANLKQLYADGAGKDAVALFIRQALTHGSPVRKQLHDSGLPLADVIVQISEVWTKEVPTAKHRKDREQYGPDYEKHPGHGEAIMVMLHTLHKSYMGTSPILENPRRAEYAPLEHLGPEWKQTGRFPMDDQE